MAAAVMGALALAAQGVVLSVVSGVAMLAGAPTGELIVLLLLVTPAAIVLASVGFLIGLIVIGAPAWLILHRLGRRRRREAIITGALLSSLGAGASLFVWTDGQAGGLWATVLLFLIPGAAAGWTLHRIAYGASPHGGLPRSPVRR